MNLLTQLKTITLLIIAGVLMINKGFAQENYLQAYVIGLKGDTIHGFIDYRNWGKNPKNVMFKKQMTDQPVLYTPLTIKSFCVADDIYAGGILLNDVSPVITDDLEYGKDPNLKPDTVFLQAIVLGSKSLYFYKNELGRFLFYIGNDTSFTLLEYKRYLFEAELTIVKENKWYLNQLAVYLNDCPTIQQDFKSLKYARKNLEKLFLTYYECTGNSLKFYNKQEKIKTEFGAVAGLTFNNLQFEPSLFYSIKEIDFSTTTSYSVALFADIILARNLGKWSVYNELAFSPYKVEEYHEVYINENDYINNTYTLGYSYLKLNTMVRYKYPIRKAYIFINAGMSNGYALKETNQLVAERKFFSSETSEESTLLYVTRLYEQGLLAGLGAKYDKYSFEFRYERGNGMSVFIDLKSTTTRYLFLLGYKF